MPILVVGTEKNFAALRPRLFAGNVSNKDAAVVAQAIRDANPQVDLAKLQPGTVLVIPEAPKLAARGELSLDATTTEAVKGLSTAGKQMLQALADAGTTREGAAKKERKRLAASLDAKEVESAARTDKKLASDLASARTAVAEEEARSKERVAALNKAQAEWTAGLDALQSLLD